MRSATAVEKARSKFRAGDPDTARNLLLEAASGPDPQPDARQTFEELFPLTPDQKQWITGTLKKLAAKEAPARAAAAKDVGRAARSEMSRKQQDKIGDPRCLDYLIPALGSQDAKVSEHAASAIARAAQFYFRDWRAWDPAVQLLKAKKQSIRYWTVEMVAYLGREKAIHALLPLFGDPSELIRTQVGAMLIWMIRSNYLSSRARKWLASELPGSLQSDEPVTRSRMVGIVRLLNDKSAIEPLRTALKTEPDESVREKMRHAIRCLEAGDPNLPM
jgi:HEAT repeat protein